jgi:hypothetical protein
MTTLKKPAHWINTTREGTLIGLTPAPRPNDDQHERVEQREKSTEREGD